MLYFPFDTQICHLKFGSWSYWKSLLNLQHTYPTNELKGNVRYTLYSHPFDQLLPPRVKRATLSLTIRPTSSQLSGRSPRKLAPFTRSRTIAAPKSTKETVLAADFYYFMSTRAACQTDKTDITFSIKVKRYQYYPVFTLVVPCVMTAMLITLTFILPPDAGEKVGLSKFLFELTVQRWWQYVKYTQAVMSNTKWLTITIKTNLS